MLGGRSDEPLGEPPLSISLSRRWRALQPERHSPAVRFATSLNYVEFERAFATEWWQWVLCKPVAQPVSTFSGESLFHMYTLEVSATAGVACACNTLTAIKEESKRRVPCWLPSMLRQTCTWREGGLSRDFESA